MSSLGPLLALLVASGGLHTDSLQQAAAATDRPKRCSPKDGAAWLPGRSGAGRRWCTRAASALGRLQGDPRGSLRLAEQLLASEPNEPFLHAVRARALLRLGKPGESWRAWSDAQRNGFQPHGPYSLLDFARSASLTGHSPTALRSYRELLQHSQLLSDPLSLQLSCIEGAVVAIRLGPDHFDEARALSLRALAEARARSAEPWSRVLHALIASLDASHEQSARSSEEEAEWLEASLASARPTTPVLPPYELQALVSFAFESQPERAAQLFSGFVEQQRVSPGPLQDWARNRAKQLARSSQ